MQKIQYPERLTVVRFLATAENGLSMATIAYLCGVAHASVSKSSNGDLTRLGLPRPVAADNQYGVVAKAYARVMTDPNVLFDSLKLPEQVALTGNFHEFLFEGNWRWPHSKNEEGHWILFLQHLATMPKEQLPESQAMLLGMFTEFMAQEERRERRAAEEVPREEGPFQPFDDEPLDWFDFAREAITVAAMIGPHLPRMVGRLVLTTVKGALKRLPSLW